jgi:NADH-quinone oxidoreductase subunit E
MSKTHVDKKKVRKVLERYPAGDPVGLIHALQDIQEEFGYVPCEAAQLASEHLNTPVSKVYSVATFYKAFSLEPRGDVIIRVCTGTACHIRGAQTLVDEICTALDIKPGGTTKDLGFTLETVYCVGACAMAPVVAVNGEYHGGVQPGAVMKLMKGGK